jgi:hypothetical protein
VLGNAWRAFAGGATRGWFAVKRFFAHTVFSTLTRRIVALNLAGLLVLVVGILYSTSGARASSRRACSRCACRAKSSPPRSALPRPSIAT